MPRHPNALPGSALAVAALLLTSCTSGPARTAATPTPRPVVAVTTPPATTRPTPTKPAGPPPKAGTVAWYVSQLPHFAAPPLPAHPYVLPAKGSAKQIDQVPVGASKVAFITIDDGWEKDPGVVTMLRAAHIPFTMFLTSQAIASHSSFFKTLQGLGGVIEDHTISHPKLSQLSYDQQRHEICANRTTLTSLYGRAPTIMRAPYGLANSNTLKAAASCGIRANVFWNEYAITGSLTWQRPGGIHPGDMVLMHFDKYLKANLLASLQAFHRSGITPALLEDYLVTSSPSPTP